MSLTDLQDSAPGLLAPLFPPLAQNLCPLHDTHINPSHEGASADPPSAGLGPKGTEGTWSHPQLLPPLAPAHQHGSEHSMWVSSI